MQTLNLVHSDDLSRAACLARQIQSLALGGLGAGAEALDTIEALAEALAYRLEVQVSTLEATQNEL